MTWDKKLIRRPGNSPEDSKVYLVRGGQRHWVVNTSWLIAHHYKWPDDVNVIPSADLDAIPLGDPIQ